VTDKKDSIPVEIMKLWRTLDTCIRNTDCDDFRLNVKRKAQLVNTRTKKSEIFSLAIGKSLDQIPRCYVKILVSITNKGKYSIVSTDLWLDKFVWERTRKAEQTKSWANFIYTVSVRLITTREKTTKVSAMFSVALRILTQWLSSNFPFKLTISYFAFMERYVIEGL